MADDSPASISTGELSRAVGLIRSDIGDLRSDIRGRPTEKDLIYLSERVKSLENWQTWALRLGGPAVVGCLIGVFSNLQARLG